MATGNTLVYFSPYDNEPPPNAFATLDLRNYHPCLDFDASAEESGVFTSIMPRHYAGGGVTVDIIWAASTNANGSGVWGVAFERLGGPGTGLDTDVDDFGAFTSGIFVATSTVGALQYSPLTFASGSEMDNINGGELFRLKIMRHAAQGWDNLIGDAELFGIEIRET